MSQPKVRNGLNYNTDAAAKATSIKHFSPSLTRQADAKSADINFIVRNYGLTGTAPQGVRIPSYEDYSETVSDYQTALNAIKAAEQSFLAIPATIRERFNHDPQAFLEFCALPSNLPALREMGLAPPVADGNPPPAPVPG